MAVWSGGRGEADVKNFFYDVNLSMETLVLMSLAQGLIDVVGVNR